MDHAAPSSPPGAIDGGATGATNAGLPSGFVTFVLTDIEGSTRLVKRLPELALSLFDRHDAILRTAWREHGGYEVSTEGDSFFVAFADTEAALAACAQAQRMLAAEPWPDDGVVRVRMGVHAGPAVQRGNNYIALAIHQGARVSNAAHGGQIVVTDTVAQRARPPAGDRLTSLGRFRLRDFDEPEPLHRLDPDGLTVNDLPIRATPAEGHNLVRQPTSFHGRDDDLEQLAPLFGPGRVVTLTGPGGVGKTRLAIEVGLAVAGDWRDGVWLVDLADLDDSALVAETVAETIGAPAGESPSRWDDVVTRLADHAALVIFDNTEPHLDTCARLIPELIARCHGVGVLTTGREPLKVAGEVVYRVSPLAAPGTGDHTIAAIERSPAVRLFCDRATAAHPGFALDAATATDVAAICARLDGLPLALEIAGARVGVLSVAEMSAGLDDRFRLLKSGDRTLPERQRTMEGLLDWSYRLLARDERAVLRRLAVFGGSFPVDAANAAVTADDLPSGAAPELVWALVDKSLVVADLGAAETRYRLPEIVRDYALRLLDATEERPAVAARLANWLLDRVGPWLITDRGWIGRAGAEIANLRGLIHQLDVADQEAAQQLACSLGRYHESVQSFATGTDELGRLVAELPAPTPTRVALLTTLADLHLRQADIDAARGLLESAAALQAAVGPPDWADASVERTRSEIELRAGRLDEAAAIATRALAGGVSVMGQARMWSALGVARYSAGDIEGAAEAFERELESYRRLGDDTNIASAHGNLAEVRMQLGDRHVAAYHQRECLGLASALGRPVMLAYSCMLASRLASERDDWALAVRLQSSAEAELAAIGHALYAADRDAADQFVEAARAELGAEVFARECEAGTALDLAAATALADEVLRRAAADDRRGDERAHEQPRSTR